FMKTTILNTSMARRAPSSFLKMGVQYLAKVTKVGLFTGLLAIAGTSLVAVPVLESIAVTPANPSVAAGLTVPFTAIGTFSDGTTVDLTESVAWSSSDTVVALISNAAGSKGVASGLAPGTTQIAAQLGSVSGPTTLTVTDAVLVAIAVTPI